MDMRMLLETMTKFAGEPEQKPGDQVRGTEKAKTKAKKHPFADRLVGDGGGAAEESIIHKTFRDYLNETEPKPFIVEENVDDLEQRLKKEYQFFTESLDHPPRPGLEGPTSLRNGKIVYYDPKRKTYIDADSESLNEYGPVGTEAPPTPPQNTTGIIQQPDMQLGNIAPTGSGIAEPGVQMNKQPVTPPVQQPNAAAQKVTQQAVVQNPQQAAQQAVAANQAATKPTTMGPQDIAMGFLKGMGVQNPQKPAIDALAKSLGKNLKVGR